MMLCIGIATKNSRKEIYGESCSMERNCSIEETRTGMSSGRGGGGRRRGEKCVGLRLEHFCS